MQQYSNPLHNFAAQGNIEEVEKLLSKGKAQINEKLADSQNTPLHVASYEGKFEMVYFLLSKGADVRARDNQGWTPLHCAAANLHLKVCALLLTRGADPNSVNIQATSPLHYIIRSQYSEELIEVLDLMIEKGVNLEVKNKYKETPLAQAAAKGMTESVRFLIDHGADLNSQDQFKQTALHRAAISGNAQTVLLLLKSGADPTLEAEGGLGTPLDIALKENKEEMIQYIQQYLNDADSLRESTYLAFQADAAAKDLPAGQPFIRESSKFQERAEQDFTAWDNVPKVAITRTSSLSGPLPLSRDSYFNDNLSRIDAETLLSTCTGNAVVIRNCSVPGCFALSQYDSSINEYRHLLISPSDQGGYKLEDCEDSTQYSSLEELLLRSPECRGYRPLGWYLFNADIASVCAPFNDEGVTPGTIPVKKEDAASAQNSLSASGRSQSFGNTSGLQDAAQEFEKRKAEITASYEKKKAELQQDMQAAAAKEEYDKAHQFKMSIQALGEQYALDIANLTTKPSHAPKLRRKQTMSIREMQAVKTGDIVLPFKGFRMDKCIRADVTSAILTDRTLLFSPCNYKNWFFHSEHYNYVGMMNRKKSKEKFEPIVVSILPDPNRYRIQIWTRLGDKQVFFPAKAPPKGIKWKNGVPADVRKFVVDTILAERKGETELDLQLEYVKHEDTEFNQKLLEFETFDPLRAKCFNVGVLYSKEGQQTEYEHFNNENGSEAFEEFLAFLGDKIRLKGWMGYKGDLDVKTDTQGTYSIYRRWKGFEIMFHVSTLLPYSPGEQQQIARKRRIGNDIGVIVFQDGGAYQPPIRSQFLHSYTVVSPIPNSDPNMETHYKVAVATLDGVPEFGPAIPDPSIFYKGQEFRTFLFTKVLNSLLASLNHPSLRERIWCRPKENFLCDLVNKYGKTRAMQHLRPAADF